MEIILEQSVIIGAALELHFSPLHIGGKNVPPFILDTVLHTHPTRPNQQISPDLRGALVVGEIASKTQ